MLRLHKLNMYTLSLKSRGTKECRKEQHWWGLQNLVTRCLEPIKGLCNGIGPIRRLEASI